MSDSQSTFTTLRNIIVESTGYDPDDVSLESNIVSDLAVDSLSIVEIAVRAEDAFGVYIGDKDAAGFTTVGDFVTFIDEHRES
ncbi:acyl carrier protein [Corynebacterium hindlerae]|uniref:Acyl carrier protein n=1 Tax=Corynebacterium hindlerae TaxID=699041 RepID=A0A7G5FE96_9CORY|nr:acyl carrier protein [Corynebacterium hindlerae]QMV84937.1 acyl carrier protein [Corynebacterium hindlerae]QTH59165.1 acyl carrier protein [Corynebacterium hindlerae]